MPRSSVLSSPFPVAFSGSQKASLGGQSREVKCVAVVLAALIMCGTSVFGMPGAARAQRDRNGEAKKPKQRSHRKMSPLPCQSSIGNACPTRWIGAAPIHALTHATAMRATKSNWSGGNNAPLWAFCPIGVFFPRLPISDFSNTAPDELIRTGPGRCIRPINRP